MHQMWQFVKGKHQFKPAFESRTITTLAEESNKASEASCQRASFVVIRSGLRRSLCTKAIISGMSARTLARPW